MNKKTYNKDKPAFDFQFGKVPPNSKSLEALILGAIMLEKGAFDIAIEIIKSECFYVDAHKIIFQAMCLLQQKNSPIDTETIFDELRKSEEIDKVGGPFALIQLTKSVFSAANIEAHCKIIYQKYLQREVIRISSEAIGNAYEDSCDAFDLVDQTEKEISGINNITSKSYSNIQDEVVSVLNNIYALKNSGKELIGVNTGFKAMNQLTCGWQSPDFIVLAARPSVGKCLSFDTKILMYDGSIKKVQDILIGDTLMGDDSNPRKVLSICTGKEKMFNVKQLNGIDYRVNGSHILSLKRSKNEGNKMHGEVLNISVSDYNKKGPGFISRWKGYKVPVNFKEKSLVVPPYLLGIWLGDGSLNKTEITKPNIEIENYLSKYCEENGNSLSIHTPENRCKSYSVIGLKGKFRNELRELGVFDNKHIPNDYLINSKENRLELLAGLLDTDGYYIKHSHGYEICQKLKRLAFQIKFLADTLGFKTSIGEKVVNGVTYYRMTIWGDIDIIPLKIERKKAAKIEHKRDWRINSIKVEFDKIDTYYGFEIDGNGLFLLEDCTVTHNTALALRLARNANCPVGFFSLEMNKRQLIQRILSAESGIHLENIIRGRLSEDELDMLSIVAGDLKNFMIDDKAAPNIYELRNKARKMKKDEAGLIIIDYLQLMSGIQNGRPDNREQEISKISRDIKGLAKELEIPIIALSQLSRGVESRQNKMPQLSDLRESGAIEQDADIVMAMYRPEYYGVNVNENGDNMNGETHIKFLKHRNGALDTIKLRAKLSIQQFYDFEEQPKQLGFTGNFRPVTQSEKINSEEDPF